MDDLRARIEQLQEMEDEIPKLRAMNETLKAKLSEAEKKLTSELNDNEADALSTDEISALRSALRAAEEENAALRAATAGSEATSHPESHTHLETQIEALKAED